MKEVYPALVLYRGIRKHWSIPTTVQSFTLPDEPSGAFSEAQAYSLLLPRALKMPLVQPPASTPKGYVKRVY